MKLTYLKSAWKCDSFDVAIGIKIPFFKVLVTIEQGRSLLQFLTTNCVINVNLGHQPWKINSLTLFSTLSLEKDFKF